MKVDLDLDTVLDVVGTGAAAYVAYALVGGVPLPLFKDIVPWIAALAVGIVTWRLSRRNNKAAK